ncbi:hypothetical protein [Fontibacillus phaseoli]|uniref:hypothetical protein n=1 Tax=Fontibacillus phaseoli TaxID=1416533 RepID=UPI0011C062C9|nr:hypothetical protein [Fontibacillus phaseoli]
MENMPTLMYNDLPWLRLGGLVEQEACEGRGLAKLYGSSQGEVYPCGWVKPDGSPTKGQVKQGSTRKDG